MTTRRGFLTILAGLTAGSAGIGQVKADAAEPSKKELERLYAKWLASWRGDVIGKRKYRVFVKLPPAAHIAPLAPLSLEMR